MAHGAMGGLAFFLPCSTEIASQKRAVKQETAWIYALQGKWPIGQMFDTPALNPESQSQEAT